MGLNSRIVLCVGAVVFGLVAWFITIPSNFLCESVDFEPVDDFSFNRTRLPGIEELPKFNMGLWNHKGYFYYQDYYGTYWLAEGCLGYSDAVDIDAKWKTARAFSVIAFVLGFLAMILNCAAVGSDAFSQNIKLIGALYVFVTLCQGLTLLQLSSDFCQDNPLLDLGPIASRVYEEECVWNKGVKLNISAIVLYFCAGLACFGASFSKGEDEEEAAAAATGPGGGNKDVESEDQA